MHSQNCIYTHKFLVVCTNTSGIIHCVICLICTIGFASLKSNTLFVVQITKNVMTMLLLQLTHNHPHTVFRYAYPCITLCMCYTHAIVELLMHVVSASVCSVSHIHCMESCRVYVRIAQLCRSVKYSAPLLQSTKYICQTRVPEQLFRSSLVSAAVHQLYEA